MSTIGLYLGFSIQGHFIRVFKGTVGMTPGEYPEKKRGYCSTNLIMNLY